MQKKRSLQHISMFNSMQLADFKSRDRSILFDKIEYSNCHHFYRNSRKNCHHKLYPHAKAHNAQPTYDIWPANVLQKRIERGILGYRYSHKQSYTTRIWHNKYITQFVLSMYLCTLNSNYYSKDKTIYAMSADRWLAKT